MPGEAVLRGWGRTPAADRRYCACQHLAVGVRALPLPPAPATAPHVPLGSPLILCLQHPSACRGITLLAWGGGQTHNSRERKAMGKGCCPPPSLPTSAEADGARGHRGQEGCARPAASRVRLGDELCRGNRSTVTSHKNQDQPQTTKSVGQSPEVEQACGAWQGSCTAWREQGGPAIEEIWLRESVSIGMRRISTSGTNATAQEGCGKSSHKQPLLTAQPQLHDGDTLRDSIAEPCLSCRRQGAREGGGAVWLLIAASVPALIDRAGRAGPCYDCLCLRGWWQHGRWWGWATQTCLLWGGMDPAWQQDEEGARKG